MDKKKEHLLRAYTCVGRGWWGIIDKYMLAILGIDPDCDFDPKEKFGEFRLRVFPSIDCESNKKQEIWRLEQEAEDESTLVCEYCGKAGRFRHENRIWYLTLCDDCDKLDPEQVRALHNEKFRLLREMEE